ncbi:MAG: hypothetical protein AABZ00_03970 [Chloroflexota bacterium]
MTSNQYDAIIIGGGERAGLKPPAQYMEALRADCGVRFSGLPRTEAGLQSDKAKGSIHDNKSV